MRHAGSRAATPARRRRALRAAQEGRAPARVLAGRHPGAQV